MRQTLISDERHYQLQDLLDLKLEGVYENKWAHSRKKPIEIVDYVESVLQMYAKALKAVRQLENKDIILNEQTLEITDAESAGKPKVIKYDIYKQKQ